MRQICTALTALALAGSAMARDNAVAPKNGLDPWDKSRMTRAEARNWVDRDPNQAGTLPSERKNCQTNIASQPAPAGPKYGPGNGSASRNDQVVVVKGDVINVCR